MLNLNLSLNTITFTWQLVCTSIIGSMIFVYIHNEIERDTYYRLTDMLHPCRLHPHQLPGFLIVTFCYIAALNTQRSFSGKRIQWSHLPQTRGSPQTPYRMWKIDEGTAYEQQSSPYHRNTRDLQNHPWVGGYCCYRCIL